MRRGGGEGCGILRTAAPLHVVFNDCKCFDVVIQLFRETGGMVGVETREQDED